MVTAEMTAATKGDYEEDFGVAYDSSEDSPS